MRKWKKPLPAIAGQKAKKERLNARTTCVIACPKSRCQLPAMGPRYAVSCNRLIENDCPQSKLRRCGAKHFNEAHRICSVPKAP
jgi:hypothetical protein